MSLREVGTLLGDRERGTAHARRWALANWHDTHTHCPVDGTPHGARPGRPLQPCAPADGTEHFPGAPTPR